MKIKLFSECAKSLIILTILTVSIIGTEARTNNGKLDQLNEIEYGFEQKKCFCTLHDFMVSFPKAIEIASKDPFLKKPLLSLFDGMKGEKGNGGKRGAIGPHGVQGVEGPRGLTGAQGRNGRDGISVKGDKGDEGIPGKRGKAGEKGDACIIMKREVNGTVTLIKGAKGDIGRAGKRGDSGRDGKVGEKGERGLQGEPGPPGLTHLPMALEEPRIHNYEDIRGPPGPPGPPGPAGPPRGERWPKVIHRRGEKGQRGDPGEKGKTQVIQELKIKQYLDLPDLENDSIKENGKMILFNKQLLIYIDGVWNEIIVTSYDFNNQTPKQELKITTDKGNIVNEVSMFETSITPSNLNSKQPNRKTSEEMDEENRKHFIPEEPISIPFREANNENSWKKYNTPKLF